MADDHPITISPNPNRVRVNFAGRTVANTTHALSLKEATYPAVQYIPRADVDMSLLTRTQHTTHCPYKGRRLLLFDQCRWPGRRERDLDLRAAVSRRDADRRLHGVLSQPRRRHRAEPRLISRFRLWVAVVVAAAEGAVVVVVVVAAEQP